MNISLNIFKSQKKIFNLKSSKYFLSLPLLYTIKHYFYNKKALCQPDMDDEGNVMDFNDMYSDLDDVDLQNMPGADQISMEELHMMKEEAEKAKTQPPFSFQRIPQMFTNQNDDKWNGLKVAFDWKPTKMFSLEYSANASTFRRLDNYRLSCLNIIPNATNPQLANVFVGRTEDQKNLMLRSQFLLSPSDRLEVNSQWGRPDVNQGINIVEYNKKFERLDLNIKLSQVENSISVLSTAYKNLFLGFEAIHIQGAQFLYRYGGYYKYNKNFSFGGIFNERFTDVSLHSQITVNRNWGMLINYTKSDNPYMKQMGMDLDLTMAHSYKYGKDTNIGVEVNYLGKIHALVTHRLNKFCELSANLQVGPLYKAKLRKDLFKGFGVGVKFSLDRFEELMTLEGGDDDLSEYKIEE